jgi:DNA-binding winged helix-turn-helix (wHTH) protein
MFVVNLRPTGMRIHFEAFTFDDGAHELRRAGEPVEISPKAFVLLGLLLAGRPRVMSHVDLRDRLWPDSHVARTSLARLVTEIRHALGDEAGTPRFVRNVHGLGYAFCGEAHAEPGAIAPGEPRARPSPAACCGAPMRSGCARDRT